MIQHEQNVLTCAEIWSKPAAGQFAAYAHAYLDSAQRLCQVLARSRRKATFERGFVVLFLMAHAVELFLKGAILRQAPKEVLSSHDLVPLLGRYRNLYPKKRFRLVVPFQTDFTLLSPKEIETAKANQPPIDQLYRYPQDRTGKLWPGVYSFEAKSCLNDIAALRSDFERLLAEYEK
jgi:hypothetical protein